MTTAEYDAKCIALLRERVALQKQYREPLARIQEIEREINTLAEQQRPPARR